jgi:hypothetical protein
MRGREQLYNDKYHERLRDKVRRHRARNAARIAAETAAKRLAAGGPGAGRRAQYIVLERVDASGRPCDVVIVQAGAALPPGLVRSPWLPSGAVSLALARALRWARLHQIGGSDFADSKGYHGGLYRSQRS